MNAEDLNRRMNPRRLELHLRWNQVATRAGMDVANLRRIRNGEIALTEFAGAGLDRALEWPDGTAWATYHGARLEEMAKALKGPPSPATPELFANPKSPDYDLRQRLRFWRTRLGDTEFFRLIDEISRNQEAPGSDADTAS